MAEVRLLACLLHSLTLFWESAVAAIEFKLCKPPMAAGRDAELPAAAL